MKTEEWVSLTRKFNATATVYRRTRQQLRLKWENLKKLARKRSTKIRMNRIQTGGGIPKYIPRMYFVPFGGDKEEEVFVFGGGVCGGGGDGDGDIGDGTGQARVLPVESIPVSLDTGITIPDAFNGSIPLSIVDGTKTAIISETLDNVINLECKLAGNADLRTPKRLTLSTPRISKKKFKTADGSSSARNFALAEYYTAKKQYVDARTENILLQNEKLKLEIDKLKRQSNEKM